MSPVERIAAGEPRERVPERSRICADVKITETGDTGVNLSFFTYGNSAVLRYTTTNTSTSANLTYYSPRTFA